MENTTALKSSILSKVDMTKEWGPICNTIQDIADKHLSTREWNHYILKARKDSKECEGSDFLCMNGRYWDWKQFSACKTEIVSTFLDYFTPEALAIIAKHI